jgi:hypothetical protein
MRRSSRSNAISPPASRVTPGIRPPAACRCRAPHRPRRARCRRAHRRLPAAPRRAWPPIPRRRPGRPRRRAARTRTRSLRSRPAPASGSGRVAPRPGRRDGRFAGSADRGGVEGFGCQVAAEEQQAADLDAGGVGGGAGVISTVAGSNGTLVLTEPRVAIAAQPDRPGWWLACSSRSKG